MGIARPTPPVRGLALLLILAVGLSAGAQEQPASDPCQGPDAPNDPNCQPLDTAGVQVNVPIISGEGHGKVVRGAPPAHGSVPGKSGSGGSGGGDMDGRAILIAAVIAAVALPAVVYAFDDDLPPPMLVQAEALRSMVDVWGGSLTTSSPSGYAGVLGRVTWARIGVEGAVEGTPTTSGWRSANAGLMLRFVPKQHIEVAVLLGGRWSNLNGQDRFDGELALPHRYTFFHIADQGGGLELRPAVLLGANGGDVRLDTAFIVPLLPHVALNLGARFFTFNFVSVNYGFVAGARASF